jgi:hypothetical protein
MNGAIRALLGGVLWVTLCGSCVHLQSRPALTVPPRLVIEEAIYDGSSLRARVLVGAQAPTVIDRRLLEHVSLQLAAVRDSATGKPIEPWVADEVHPPATGDELVTLREGEWFGRSVYFLVSLESDPSSERSRCIDFELHLHLPEAGAQNVIPKAAARACVEIPSEGSAPPSAPQPSAPGAPTPLPRAGEGPEPSADHR